MKDANPTINSNIAINGLQKSSPNATFMALGLLHHTENQQETIFSQNNMRNKAGHQVGLTI
jgi:hypothetical protein